MSGFNPRWVEGLTIVRCETNPVVVSDGHYRSTMHNPVFVLSNGARIRFSVQEDPQGGEYGISPIYSPPRRGKAK